MGETGKDYTAEAVEAARSVILELTHLLGAYRDRIVLIGGWVPPLLFPHVASHHVGSVDMDLALDHRKLADAGYRTIRRSLLARGYVEGSQPFIFLRRVVIGGRTVTVEVDLLAGEYGGTGRGHRTQRVQDVRPRKARGCDLAFENPVEIHLEGTLPGGGKDSGTVRVASIVPFLVMKGIALADRMKAKDAWDIDFCLTHYPGGLGALALEFRPHLKQGIVLEALRSIGEKFASPDHYGPRACAEFENLTDREDRAIRQRAAYERVADLLAGVGMPLDPHS